MFLLNDKKLIIDAPFEHNDTLYPANWLRLSSYEDRESLGIVEVPDEQSYDDNFYLQDGSPKDLTELKEHYISTFNIMANSILSKTDWYVIRKMERNIDIPQEISEFRSSVINNCNEICETIKASEDVESLKIAIINSEWNYI